MMNDLITVIIPVYNVEPYFDRCMSSVLGQTYSNLEIILVDDKSSDRSNEMCLEYERKDSRITVVHGENKGLSGARNSGLDIACGKYVVFIDSDDYIEQTMIENLYNCALETEADTVIGGFRRKIGQKIIIHQNVFAGKIYSDPSDIKNYVLKKMLGTDGIDKIEMSVWKVLFSMNIIKENNLRFPDKKYLCEDIIFDFDYYPRSKRVAMCADTGYCYCLNGESLSQAYQKNKFERIKFQTLEMKIRAEQERLDEEAFLRLDYFFIGNVIHHMKTMVANGIPQKECIREFKNICNDENVRQIRWMEVKKCFTGRDKIPYSLLRDEKIHFLYCYLRILTIVRSVLRR